MSHSKLEITIYCMESDLVEATQFAESFWQSGHLHASKSQFQTHLTTPHTPNYVAAMKTISNILTEKLPVELTTFIFEALIADPRGPAHTINVTHISVIPLETAETPIRIYDSTGQALKAPALLPDWLLRLHQSDPRTVWAPDAIPRPPEQLVVALWMTDREGMFGDAVWPAKGRRGPTVGMAVGMERGERVLEGEVARRCARHLEGNAVDYLGRGERGRRVFDPWAEVDEGGVRGEFEGYVEVGKGGEDEVRGVCRGIMRGVGWVWRELDGLRREVRQEEARDLEVVKSCVRVLKGFEVIGDLEWKSEVLDIMDLLRENSELDGTGIFHAVAKRVGRARLNSYIDEWTKFERRPLRIRRA
ncbi:hypothetical protein GLAREA_02414 [Glarea lozoyensis ATCC 20868]|uniref:Uncharacterized protein n=1 Tax=Glarea lozoyensis (strain ATCC 20868 / MF5171) TaxID=1116229 RepID=S3D353_GLAL2|nr:uncharacterized protein GLAREA_02414 [Glarea lozoyensis ATCC 20868]EPE26501.1 hypothetical protein GLAREA_02414 [Glarea lozoyensis ATCC 20868]